ncbi:MAG: nucleotidyltransferase domain-containing protein [Candidatus Edwardsbacteria bacterium]
MDKKIAETLKEFKSVLEAKGIKVYRLILFGSYATGKTRRQSDIDIAIISESFKGMNLLQRLETIGLILAKARIMEPIEALGYTKEEFASKGKGTFIGDEVKSKGVQVI